MRRDQVTREPVDSRGHGCVRREDRAGAYRLERSVERETGAGHQLTDPLQAQEARVALVGVEHVRGSKSGQLAIGTDGADAADAEDHLLQQSVIGPAAVQSVGHRTFVGTVLLDVAVQQQQRHPADVGPADVGRDAAVARKVDVHRDRPSLGIPDQRQWQVVRVEQRVALLLPPFHRQRLPEVAGAVEQPHTNDRHAQVGSRLEVVTGQDAQAAGVLRQGRRDPELG